MPGSTTLNNEVTREIVAAILIKPLEAASVVLSSGVRVFDTDGSPVRIPKLLGMTLPPTFVGENELIPDNTEPNTGEVVLLPRTMKSVKVITRFSRELARQSVVALDAALKDRLSSDVAAVLDTQLVAGNGGTPAGSQPIGMLNWPGTTALAVNGDLGLDHLLDAIGLAMASNNDPTSGFKWFMRSNTFIKLRKLKDGGGKYLIEPDPTLQGAYRLFGIPVTVTNRIPEIAGTPVRTSVVLADMSKVAVARDTNPSVTVLTERYAEFDQIGLRVTARYDAAPLLPEAIVVLRGVNA